MTRLSALVLAGFIVLVGYVVVYDEPVEIAESTKPEAIDVASDPGLRRLQGVDSGAPNGASLKDVGLAGVRTVKAGDDFDAYIEWGSTSQRPAQSIGDDVDAEDLSVFALRATEIVGEPLDIEDIAVLDENPYADIGNDIDVEDVVGYDATVVAESVGEELDPQLPQG